MLVLLRFPLLPTYIHGRYCLNVFFFPRKATQLNHNLQSNFIAFTSLSPLLSCAISRAFLDHPLIIPRASLEHRLTISSLPLHHLFANSFPSNQRKKKPAALEQQSVEQFGKLPQQQDSAQRHSAAVVAAMTMRQNSLTGMTRGSGTVWRIPGVGKATAVKTERSWSAYSERCVFACQMVHNR